MCQIFGVAGINKNNRKQVLDLVKEVTPHMTDYEQDGFGYAAVTDKGGMFSERWVKPEDAWINRPSFKPTDKVKSIPKAEQNLVKLFGDFIEWSNETGEEEKPLYDRSGKGSLKSISAIIMHSRTATDGKVELKNVHPFIKNDTALVHNGIVWNHKQFTKELSDCDSEVILHQYLKNEVNKDSSKLEESIKHLNMYFACMVLSKASDGTPILDIFKNNADLEIIYLPELKVYLFATDSKNIVEVCVALGYKYTRAFKVNDNVLIRLNAITGIRLETKKFNYEQRTFDNTDMYNRSRHGNRSVIPMHGGFPSHGNFPYGRE